MSMQLTSPDFINGGRIPQRFTCEGEGVSPSLAIGGLPEGTQSLALILDDPDAPSGTFTHWVAWNIPPETESIASATLPLGAVEGLNSARTLGYIGPCPPSGVHNYIFTLYALDETLTGLLPEGTDQKLLREKIAGHILSQTELVGLYGE